MLGTRDEAIVIKEKKSAVVFARAAASYNEAAVLQREVANRLLSRLDLIKSDPRKILDLGARTGYTTGRLSEYYPQACVIGCDVEWWLAASEWIRQFGMPGL